MAVELTPKQLADEFRRFAQYIEDISFDLCVEVMKDLEGRYKNRIFKKGLASDGNRIGQYRSRWKDVRKAKGRQTNFVDLDFSSDLRLSIQTGKTGKTCRLGFINDFARLKAEGNTRQRKKPIFEITKDEEKAIEKAFDKALDFQLKKFF